MKRPLQVLQKQVSNYLSRAAANEAKTIQLSQGDFHAFKTNFSQLCYEVQYGQLDEVYHTLVNDPSHKNGIFQERDLNNILIILETIKAVE